MEGTSVNVTFIILQQPLGKGGSLEAPSNTELMTSAEGIGRTLQNGSRLFKQRLLLFFFVTIPVLNTLHFSLWAREVIIVGNRARASAPILSIQQFVRFEATILFDRQGNRRGLGEARSIWEQKIIWGVFPMKWTPLLRRKQELEMVCVSRVSKTCTIRATIWL